MHTQHTQIGKQESADTSGSTSSAVSSTRQLIRTVQYFNDGTVVIHNNNNNSNGSNNNNDPASRSAPSSPDHTKSYNILGTTEDTTLLSFPDNNANTIVQQSEQAQHAHSRGPAQFINLADPAPAALYAFGCTTMLYCSHIVTGAKMDSDIMGMILYYGGLTQFISGFLECIRGNTVPFTIFTAFGAFWLSIAASNSTFEGTFSAAEPRFSAGHSIIWGCLTTALLCASLRAPVSTIVTLSLLVLFFFMLTIATYAQSPTMVKVTGAEGVLLGAAAFYGATAHLFQSAYGRRVLP